MIKTTTLTGVLMCAAVGAAAGQERDPAPLRAPETAIVAAPAPRGTASLSGRVVIDGNDRPARRAIVTLSGSELSRSLSTITDANGRFTFSALPAGRFVVTASKAAHLTSSFGARQPGRPGTPVSVADGQAVTNIQFQLPVGAVITGAVRNQYGQPLSGLSIVAGRPGLDRPGGSQSILIGDAKTDDRGVYRIFGLEPGSYVVGVVQRLNGGATAAPSEEEVNEVLAALQRGAPAPGRTAPTSTVAPPAALRTASVAPIFFPGTADFTQAQAIVVRASEERTGVDITYRPVPAVKLSGTIASADGGELPAVQIGFASDVVVQLPGYSPVQPSLLQAPGKDGRFEYVGVIPGRYTITVRTTAAPAPPPTFSPVTAPADALWGLASVTVTDADVEGVAMTLGPGLRLPGRIQFDATSLTPPPSPNGMSLSLAPRREGGISMTSGTVFGTLPPPPATIEQDYSLLFRGLVPGVYQLNSSWPAGKGWWLRSAVADGVDILDIPLEILPGGRLPSSLLVTYSDRQTELSGILQTAGGRPAPEYFIVAFSTDERTWRPQARRLASARPATDGAFFIRNLPPGEYYLAALTDLDPAEWQTPAFLNQLAPLSLKFTLTDGQKFRQDLRVQ